MEVIRGNFALENNKLEPVLLLWGAAEISATTKNLKDGSHHIPIQFSYLTCERRILGKDSGLP